MAIASPSVSIRVVIVAFPETTKKKNTAKLTARITNNGWPLPFPSTEFTDAAST